MDFSVPDSDLASVLFDLENGLLNAPLEDVSFSLVNTPSPVSTFAQSDFEAPGQVDQMSFDQLIAASESAPADLDVLAEETVDMSDKEVKKHLAQFNLSAADMEAFKAARRRVKGRGYARKCRNAQKVKAEQTTVSYQQLLAQFHESQQRLAVAQEEHCRLRRTISDLERKLAAATAAAATAAATAVPSR